METIADIARDACEEAYEKVNAALKENSIEFTREGRKYTIPNFQVAYREIVPIASDALQGMPFHATEIPYREDTSRKPEFMAVLHLDDETYTFF